MRSRMSGVSKSLCIARGNTAKLSKYMLSISGDSVRNVRRSFWLSLEAEWQGGNLLSYNVSGP
jgi:hypothetical protein